VHATPPVQLVWNIEPNIGAQGRDLAAKDKSGTSDPV